MSETTLHTPSDWYEEASKRPIRASMREIAERRQVAEIFRRSSAADGMTITEEMLLDEELLILGKMDRPEWREYINLKEGYRVHEQPQCRSIRAR